MNSGPMIRELEERIAVVRQNFAELIEQAAAYSGGGRVFEQERANCGNPVQSSFGPDLIVCASPDYIARRGRPVQPADLMHHSCLILSRNPGSTTWPFEVGGKLMKVEVKGPVSADSTAMLLGLAIEGAGILRLSEHVVGEAIQKGQLLPLLQDVRDPEKYPLWALLPPGRNQTPKVRVFLDFLLERLGSAPWRTGSEASDDRKSKHQPIQN
jgi:hypothetical protein